MFFFLSVNYLSRHKVHLVTLSWFVEILISNDKRTLVTMKREVKDAKK